MSWERWKKGRTPGSGGFADQGKNKLYRDPWTHDLVDKPVWTNSSTYRLGWNANKCTGSNDCGSGFACIDGQCVKVWTSDGSDYEPAGCGQSGADVEWAPCHKSPEKTTPNDSCSKPSPGTCDTDPECPGDKCCRMQRNGVIRCVCGPCEQTDTGTCNVWCDQNYKNYGKVGTGCFTRDMDGFGECDGNICDECTFCEDTFFGYAKCVNGEVDDPFNPLPCWCFSECAENCHKCNTDLDSSNYGECEYHKEDCMQCCTIYNYKCPQCPRGFPGAQNHCEPVTSGKPCIQALREKLYKQCAEDCETEGDPCRPTGSTSYCDAPGVPVRPNSDPTFDVGGPEGLACPAVGKRCEYTGYMTVGNTTCYFWNTYDPEILAERGCECESLECNCHSDCGDCQRCFDGTCTEDLDCTDRQGGWWRWVGTANGTLAYSTWFWVEQSTWDEGFTPNLSYNPDGTFPSFFSMTEGEPDTPWYTGPIVVEKNDQWCNDGSVGPWQPIVYFKKPGELSYGATSSDGSIGRLTLFGGDILAQESSWIPEVVGCWDPEGTTTTYGPGRWEYGGDSVTPPAQNQPLPAS